MRRGLLAFAVLLLSWGAAQGQQLDFARAVQGNEEKLSYRWRDSAMREHLTSFSLSRRDIADAEASFREFSLAGMWGAIEADLREETASFGNGARIDFTRERNRLMWTASARDAGGQAALIHRLNARFERAQKAYLSRHLRRRTEEGRILIDFAAAAMFQEGPLRGVSQALAGTPGISADERARVALALAFFQQIPYVGLGDGEARGSDFLARRSLWRQCFGPTCLAASSSPYRCPVTSSWGSICRRFRGIERCVRRQGNMSSWKLPARICRRSGMSMAARRSILQTRAKSRYGP